MGICIADATLRNLPLLNIHETADTLADVGQARHRIRPAPEDMERIMHIAI